MQLREELLKRFFIRLFVGALPLGFFAAAMLVKGESGNSGMSLNMQKFLPIILLFAWGGFLIIEAFYLFAKNRISYGLRSIYALLILAAGFVLIMYMEHSL